MGRMGKKTDRQINTEGQGIVTYTTAQNPDNNPITGTHYSPIIHKKPGFWQVQGLWYIFPPSKLAGAGLHLQLWRVQLQCPLIWPHCLFPLPNLHIPQLLCIPAMPRKTKGMVLFLKGLVSTWVLERSWVGYFCSWALHGNHPQVWGFWYFKNTLSAGILQPAGGSLSSLRGVLAPSLLPGPLEGAEILGSQIKAKGSVWIGRKERAVFHTGWKTLLWGTGYSVASSQSLNFFTIKPLSPVMLILLSGQAGVSP